METQKMIDKFLEEIIKEFKNIKRIRGDIFSNFVSFVNLYLTGLKDDKYKDIKKNILHYIVLNRETIIMKLIQN
tara:strand:+ start:726 stop:947 length:222 start_codon:yes stop_codon:yes gene_type:complete